MPIEAPIGVARAALTSFTPDERSLVSASGDGTVRVWDLAQAHPLVRAIVRNSGDPYIITALAWSPNGRLLASGGFDGAVRIGAVAQGELRQVAPAVDNPMASVQFSPDGSTLASLAYLHPVVLWKLPATKMAGHIAPEGVSDLKGQRVLIDEVLDGAAFAEEGRALAVLDDEHGVLRFWDRQHGRWESRSYRVAPAGSGGPYTSTFAISPAGSVVATGDIYGSIYLWRAAGEQVGGRFTLHRPTLESSEVISLGFSADGSVLVSAVDDKVRFWDVRRRLPLGEPLPAAGAAAFSPKDSTLASAVGRREIGIWDKLLLSTDVAAWERRICPVVQHGLTRSEWQRFLPGEVYRPACGP